MNGGVATPEEVKEMVAVLLEMAKSDEREFKSFYRRMLLHLLKYKYQPEKQSRSWIESILDSRSELSVFYSDKSLIKTVSGDLLNQYIDAKRKASRETGKSISVFPENIPVDWSLENIVDYDFIIKFLKDNATTVQWKEDAQ